MYFGAQMSRINNGYQSKNWDWLPELSPESQEILRSFGANKENKGIERHHLVVEGNEVGINEIVKDLSLVRGNESLVDFKAGGCQIETDENAHLFKDSFSKTDSLGEVEVSGDIVREVPIAKLTGCGGSVKSLRVSNGITRRPVLLGKR